MLDVAVDWRDHVHMKRYRARGFTLVELLAVVAIVGILACLAVTGFRKLLNMAHTSSAQAVIQGIRGA